MAKFTVEKVDETLEQRVKALEVGQNWVSAVVRKIAKELKEHFGMNVEGRSSIGLVFAVLLVSVCASFAVDTVVDWSTGLSGTIGTAKITTDGTNATLTVDKIAAGVTNVVQSTGMTVTGPVSVSGAQTNSGTLKVVGLATLNNLTVSTNIAYTASSGTVTHSGSLTVATNLTVTGTSLHTGVATFTAIPNFNAAKGTNGNVTALITNGVASMTADATWLPITVGGTNYWFPAFLKN